MIELNSSKLLTAKAKLKIPFHDIDPAGVAWHGRYFKYFEQARVVLLEDINYSYAGMHESGYLWPVAETNVRYVRPLLLDQLITVSAVLAEWEFRLVVDYKIYNEEGTLCTRAKTIQVPVDAKTLELQLGCPEILINNVNSRIAQLSTAAI
jgi:acyl-CoA thioester hydrolase